MLQHALDVCRDLGLESATLGCYKANVASAAVMKKCGGTLVAENENYTEGQKSQYYKIRLV
jgi:predicted acetyltransferase